MIEYNHNDEEWQKRKMAALMFGKIRSAVESNRVRVPAKFYKNLGDSFYIAPGKGGCILLVPSDNVDYVLGKYVLNSDQYTMTEFDEFVRNNINDVQLDGQGRLTFDEEMREMCDGLDSAVEVMFSGGGLYVELWPAAVYDKKYGNFDSTKFNSLIANLRASLNNGD